MASIAPVPIACKTPEESTFTPLLVPPAVTERGVAVELESVWTERIVPPDAAAVFSPKVNAVFPLDPKAQFHTCALVLLLIVLPVVAAVSAESADPLPAPHAASVLLHSTFHAPFS